MKSQLSILMFLIALFALCLPASAGNEALLESLRPEKIAGARISLEPAGADIGFEMEIEGGDARLEPLLEVIRTSEAGGGHKCPNEGAIRFFIKGGGIVGIGLLPSHSAGRYELRLYDGDRHLETRIVDRERLLTALEGLGVPTSDPAFE
jgi:hypothetical protein